MPPAFFNWAEIFSRIFSCSALSGNRKRYHRASCSASALLTSASVGNLSMLIVPILLQFRVLRLWIASGWGCRVRRLSPARRVSDAETLRPELSISKVGVTSGWGVPARTGGDPSSGCAIENLRFVDLRNRYDRVVIRLPG